MPAPVMLPTDRLDYSPIAGRPQLILPGGARLVVWVIVNVEDWDPREPMPPDRADAAGRWCADARHPKLGLA